MINEHFVYDNGTEQWNFIAANSSGSDGSSFVWSKPKNSALIHIMLMSAGGNGGASHNGNTSYSSGGGGSGATLQVFIPGILCPSTLYIWLAAGGTELDSFIDCYTVSANNQSRALFLKASGGAGSNGGASTTTSVGSAGTAGRTSTVSGMAYNWGLVRQQAGQAGVIGVTTGTGTSNIASVVVTLGGAAAGAGNGAAANPGGSVIAQGAKTIAILGGSSASFPHGNDGYTIFSPHYSAMGGSGAAAADGDFSIGNNGGNGAIGCGGGGASPGTTSGGTPGRGGPSMCIISSMV